MITAFSVVLCAILLKLSLVVVTHYHSTLSSEKFIQKNPDDVIGIFKTLYKWALQPGTFQFKMFITREVAQFWFVFLAYRSFLVYRAARRHKKHG